MAYRLIDLYWIYFSMSIVFKITRIEFLSIRFSHCSYVYMAYIWNMYLGCVATRILTVLQR